MGGNSENILSGSKIEAIKEIFRIFYMKKMILSMYPNLVIFKDTASRLFTKYQHFHVNLLAKIKQSYCIGFTLLTYA